MITSRLNELELAEVWAEEDSEIRFTNYLKTLTIGYHRR